ncbi:MAG TPA: enoyl-CoA hydratase/isomerase family protein [Thermoanaerobaculia bacterium]|jgi:enoyl-CoA hydratase/carnithine racemase|nr:enoyl-CoA hydratase/isomerase family protein [Thermoanaerobaculia bacterium]
MRFLVTRFTDTVEIAFDDGGMNLLSSDALRELRDVVAGCETTLVFRSGQSRLFAAGADMAEMERFSAMDAYAFARLGQEVFETIERLPCLTIAMIDGDCFGGALDLVLAFDLRYATPRSRFAHPGARIGIVTGFGGTSRWRKVLTRPAANQLFLANRTLNTEEALRLGIIDGVWSAAAAAAAFVCHSADSKHTKAAAAAAALQTIKELTNRADRLSRSELLLLAQRFQSWR